MSRRTLEEIRQRWARIDANTGRALPRTKVLSPTEAEALCFTSTLGPCLTHLTRYVVDLGTHKSYQAQCGQVVLSRSAIAVDPAEELFGCARCLALAERWGEPTYNLVPTSGCEASEGRHRGRKPKKEPPMTTDTPITVTIEGPRLGRGGPVGPLVVTTTEAAKAEAIYDAIASLARNRLNSSEYTIAVFNDGTWSVESGRYGHGTWEVRSDG